MMHGSAFDHFGDDDEFVDETHYIQNGSSRSGRPGGRHETRRETRYETSGGGHGGGGHRVIREERRGRHSSPRRNTKDGRHEISPRRKSSPRRHTSSSYPMNYSEHSLRSERSHRRDSPQQHRRASPPQRSHRRASPPEQRRRTVREEYHHVDSAPVTQRSHKVSRRHNHVVDYNSPEYDIDDLGEDFQTVKVSRGGRSKSAGKRDAYPMQRSSSEHQIHNGGGNGYTTYRSESGHHTLDGGHRTARSAYPIQRSPSGRSGRSRGSFITDEVTNHIVDYNDDDDDEFDAELAFVRRPRNTANQRWVDPSKMVGGKKFLRDWQDELDDQRNTWEDEVSKLSQGSLLRGVPKDAMPEGSNSYVDTSTGSPIFKAFFDVSEMPRKGINVSIDKIAGKIIVKGQQGTGTLTRSFTQKAALPKFADDQRMRTKVSKTGILKVEMPLIYYFAEEKSLERKPKSFVNEIRTRRDGTQVLEILVNAGTNVKARDLKVMVTEENELVIKSEKERRNGEKESKTVKRYMLPSMADLEHIKSRLGKDGRLVVHVPLIRKAIHD